MLGDVDLASPAGGNGAKNGEELDIETELKGGESSGGGLVIRLGPVSIGVQESDGFFKGKDAGALFIDGRSSVEPSA